MVDERAPEPQFSHTARGRVVFAWSAAGGKVAASAHVAFIKKAAAASRACFDDPDAPALHEVKNASCDALRDALDRARAEGEPVDVLHLLCRGAVRLVVVSACDGGNAGEVGQAIGSVAQQLRNEGFRAVVASRLPLSWEGANAFATALYEALLGRLEPLEAAFRAARSRLLGRASYDWASLQLYARGRRRRDVRLPAAPLPGPRGVRPRARPLLLRRDLVDHTLDVLVADDHEVRDCTLFQPKSRPPLIERQKARRRERLLDQLQEPGCVGDVREAA